MGSAGGAKVTFSPEQQVKVDELIDRAYAKGRCKGIAEAQAEIDTLRAHIAELENKKSSLAFWRRK